jgi:hypothetical protein
MAVGVKVGADVAVGTGVAVGCDDEVADRRLTIRGLAGKSVFGGAASATGGAAPRGCRGYRLRPSKNTSRTNTAPVSVRKT